MQLREGEQILRTYHHHILPMVFQIIKVSLGSAPFFAIIYFARNSMSIGGLSIALGVIIGIFGILILHIFVDDRLDRLVITNKRIVMIDWKMIILKVENEVDIRDIQEVKLTSRGILSSFRIFDYGVCTIETASHDLSICFIDAPHPSQIRDFIFSLKKV
ncbi:MAG: hypothetical protein US89_C0003G0015 [Candidatus Peregrinibacteria bacterium GW2011_GWF2_38_29]|nr:MAG: hypothetical protein US89_C0003G0015 [Candidatus Peregrinibacteria bacterium GW2011_GWF2_38_29]HBB02897.1 hypothetical protein [Candidatus Peregrinibacteria bacterium]